MAMGRYRLSVRPQVINLLPFNGKQTEKHPIMKNKIVHLFYSLGAVCAFFVASLFGNFAYGQASNPTFVGPAGRPTTFAVGALVAGQGAANAVGIADVAAGSCLLSQGVGVLPAYGSCSSGSGTVTSVSVVSANGLAGTVATPSTTPAITLSTSVNAPCLQGNGTAISGCTVTGSGGTIVEATGPTISAPTVTSSFNATGLVTYADLVTQAANTIIGNATGATAAPTAVPVPSCSTASSALTYTSGTGFGCNTISSGSGTVNAGTINQLGYYAASGNVISGTAPGTTGPAITMPLASVVTVQYNATSNTTLTVVPGLSVNVLAAGTYYFSADVYMAAGTGTGGWSLGTGGTATATSFSASLYYPNTSGTVSPSPVSTTFGASIIASSAVTTLVAASARIRGTIVVNTAGTFAITFAQDSSSATASSVLINSTLILIRIT
jgi:hypothetical protein